MVDIEKVRRYLANNNPRQPAISISRATDCYTCKAVTVHIGMVIDGKGVYICRECELV